MSIIDAIKKSVLEQFTQTVTIEMIIFSLLTAFIIALVIVFVYKKTYSGVIYSKNTALTIILLTMITAMIIRTINSNLSLSLGMVGALSIVRFRTAIKEPVDTAFLFWGITGGIMAGAGLYLVAFVSTLALSILYFISYAVNGTDKTKYLLVIVYEAVAEDKVAEKVKTLKKTKLKSKTINSNNIVEVSYEVTYNKETDDFLYNVNAIAGVKSVNMVTYVNNDFGA